MKNLNEMLVPELEQLLQSFVQKAVNAGHVWADAKAQYESLDEKKHTYLSTIMNKFEGSDADRKRQAYAHDEYKTYLEGVKEARKQYLHAQVDYDMFRLRVEATRSVLSNRRVEDVKFHGG